MLRPAVLAAPVYRQGTAPKPGGFKLSSNENPFQPLPSVAASAFGVQDFHRYPDAAMPALRAALAAKFGVSVDEVHVGAGSVALLYQLVAAAAGPGDEYVFAWRSFEAYHALGLSSGAVPVPIPLLPSARHDLAAMLAAVNERTRVVLLCSPNNPTGTVLHHDEVVAFLRAIPATVLVVLDEAYAEFVRDAAAVNGLNVRSEFPNLVVLRTFSKAYGLAGLRIGYAIGHPAVLAGARATAIPLSVTDVAQQAALASLEPVAEGELLHRVSTIADRRDELVCALRSLGFRVPEAHGNFVWLAFGEQTAAVAERFANAGIVVRPFAGEGIRVSVGEAESVQPFLQLAAEVLTTLPGDHPVRNAEKEEGS